MAETLIKLAPSLSELASLQEGLEAFGEQAELSLKLVTQLNLIIEELVTNTINYGCTGDREYWLTVGLQLVDGLLTVTIEDNAEPFDPTEEAPEVDTTAALEDRKIGGLGIHIVTAMVDQLHYSREGDVNRLVLKKDI